MRMRRNPWLRRNPSAFKLGNFLGMLVIGGILGSACTGKRSVLWDSQVADAQKPQLRTEAPKLKLSDPLPANLFVELARAINPAVVNISTSSNPSLSDRGGFRDPFFEMLEELYGLRRQLPQQRRPQALGTGFVIREDGLIVTNNHVIANSDVVNVQFNEKSDRLIEAKVVGSDERTDIALIKIEGGPYPTVALGSSKDTEVGEWVAAFGNPFGNGHTMTKGIISAKGRDINEINRFPLLQTDTPINPGNSGGPLVNTRGAVIGVNSAIDARAQGIGFAIPIDEVKAILPALEKVGRLKKGYLGVALDQLNPSLAQALGLKELEGAVIAQVEPGGPADRAGLKPYDVILKFGDKKVRAPEELSFFVADTPVGSSVTLRVHRKNKEQNLNVSVGERPETSPRRARAGNGSRVQGQKTPMNFGIEVADPNKEIRDNFGLDEKENRVVVVRVEPGSLAAQVGLRSGDLVLDVNQVEVKKASDVGPNLKKGTNTLRISRGPAVIFVTVDLR